MRFLIVLLLMCLCLINAQNLNPCFGVTDDTFFPHPRTLTKFLACFDGILVEGSCPPGMDFNRIELFCDLSQNPTTTRRPNDGNICAGVPDETFLAHPNSKRKYIICVNGDVLEFNCPDEFPIFHPVELYCDLEEKITTRFPAPTQVPTKPSSPTRTPLPIRPTPPARPTVRPTPSARPTVRPTPSARPTFRPTPSARPTVRPTPSARPTVRPTPSARPPARPPVRLTSPNTTALINN